MRDEGFVLCLSPPTLCAAALAAPVYCRLNAWAIQVDVQELYRNHGSQPVREKQTTDIYDRCIWFIPAAQCGAVLARYCYMLPTCYCLQMGFFSRSRWFFLLVKWSWQAFGRNIDLKESWHPTGDHIVLKHMSLEKKTAVLRKQLIILSAIHFHMWKTTNQAHLISSIQLKETFTI